MLDGRRPLDRGVRIRLQRHHGPPPVGPVHRDEHLRLGVVDPVLQGLGGESAEHDGVRRSDPRARQHGHGQLGDHAHVDGDPVALADPERLQRVREPADLLVQLAVRERALLAGLALPVVGDLLAASGAQVAVQAVVGHVQLPPQEPLHPGRVPLADRAPALEPVQPLRLLGPERLRVGGGVLVDRVVTHDGALTERGGRLEHALLGQQRLDGGVLEGVALAHGRNPSWGVRGPFKTGLIPFARLDRFPNTGARCACARTRAWDTCA